MSMNFQQSKFVCAVSRSFTLFSATKEASIEGALFRHSQHFPADVDLERGSES